MTAERINELFDHFGENIPAEALQSCRAVYAAADEQSRFEFLIRTASHLTLRLSEECADPIDRAGHLLVEWFLAPEASTAHQLPVDA